MNKKNQNGNSLSQVFVDMLEEQNEVIKHTKVIRSPQQIVNHLTGLVIVIPSLQEKNKQTYIKYRLKKSKKRMKTNRFLKRKRNRKKKELTYYQLVKKLKGATITMTPSHSLINPFQLFNEK